MGLTIANRPSFHLEIPPQLPAAIKGLLNFSNLSGTCVSATHRSQPSNSTVISSRGMTSTHNAVIFRDFGMISQFICDHIGYATHLVQMETTPFLEDLISDEFHHQQQLIDSAPHDSCQRSYSVANECEKENFPVTSQSAVVQTEMNAVQDVTLVADRLLLRKGSVRGVKNIVKNNKSELLQQSVLVSSSSFHYTFELLSQPPPSEKI